jgi:uncharacterized damage-inducible protein DinB
MIIEALCQEIESEGATARRVLERVPADQLTWRPHPKSMSMGQLALHVAQAPGFLANMALGDSFDFGTLDPTPAQPANTGEILTAHDESVKQATAIARQLGDAGMMREWSGLYGTTVLMKTPKAGLYRTLVLNHWIHHRGQLSVYLRLVNVPVPPIYGPSADENPFAVRV